MNFAKINHMNTTDLQEKVKKFVKDNQFDSPEEVCVLDLVCEVGEAAKEILKMTDYGRSSLKRNKEIKEEIGDVFYSLVVLANKFNVSLDEALDLVLKKYQKRLKKANAGSEVDKK